MKIDLIIDGDIYIAKPYIGKEECADCALSEICDDFTTQPCRIYPSKVIFEKSLSDNNPKAFVKEYTPEQVSFLSSSIFESDLSTMTKGALSERDIRTFYDVLNIGPVRILHFRYIGRKAINDIKQIFESHGIVWTK